MKTIGLIGGISWESSMLYYRILNETVKERLGGYHSANCLMYSFDFDIIQHLQHRDEWDKLTDLMIDAAKRLETAGADFVIICANTMHKMADEVQQQIKIPILHIADVLVEKIKRQGITKVGLLGTRFTMEHAFYKDRLQKKHGLDVLIPNEAQRKVIHDVIFNELVKGIVSPSSKEKYIHIISSLQQQGARGIISGCTEFHLLVQQNDCTLPLFDTTKIHAKAAVDYAIS